MRLQKTEKARLELQPGVRTLGQRERTLLLLADGQKTILDVSPFFDGQVEQLVTRLVSEGYLEGIPLNRPLGSTKPASTSKPAPTSSSTSSSKRSESSKRFEDSKPAPEPVAAPAKSAADSFEGKRSLATTRMFLFDLCERMFARRAPELADGFREALRNAKDRDSMLAVSRDMMAEVEKVAGHERADSISERIAMLLPVEG